MQRRQKLIWESVGNWRNHKKAGYGLMKEDSLLYIEESGKTQSINHAKKENSHKKSIWQLI